MGPRTRQGLRLAATLTVAIVGSRVEAGGLYSVVNLGSAGPLGGISDAGQAVIGNKLVWQNGHASILPIPDPDWGVSHTTISPGGTIAYSSGVSEQTHVIRNGKDYDAGAVSYSMSSGPHASPRAVNDSGVVVGESHTLMRLEQAFVGTPQADGTYRDVSLGAKGGWVSTATAVNNAGTVAGWTDVGQWRNQAFVGSTSNVIGTLGGQHSAATAINDKGQVVGFSNIATDWKPPANPENYFTPEPTHAFLYQNGKMTDLGTLPGYADSSAMAINAFGQIVGHASNTSDAMSTGSNSFILSPERAVLFNPGGGVVDLNDLIGPASGWILKDATAINAGGQIVGTGTYNGVDTAFLLTPDGVISPVPEPSSLAMFAAVASGLALLRRRRRLLDRT